MKVCLQVGDLCFSVYVGLNEAQDASHPPVAGHDDPAHGSAASVVVGPGVVPPERLAHSHTVSVAAAALSAADPVVVQHWVNVHFARLTLQASLIRVFRVELCLHILFTVDLTLLPWGCSPLPLSTGGVSGAEPEDWQVSTQVLDPGAEES